MANNSRDTGNVEKEADINGSPKITEPANSNTADVSITKEKVTSPGLDDIADATKFLVRGVENGIVNRSTGSSIALRQSGQINLSASKYSQYKLNPSGKIMEESLESVTVTNRKKYSTDDIVINEHKMNPYMYELTDMKELSNHYNNKMLVGNFTAFGTVLVKAWEPELKRYVLIRRLARMPMFSPVLNVPEINPGLDISDPLKVDHNILAKSTKGYQVNKPLHDKASLIGKAGVDRAGINRSGNMVSATRTPNNNGPVDGNEIISGMVPNSNMYANIANAIGQNTGLSGKLIWAQMFHETGGFDSELAAMHNYGGMKDAAGDDVTGTVDKGKYKWTVTGFDSRGHSYFASDQDYISYASWYLNLYEEEGLLQAKTVNQFANALKAGGYFTDDITNYANGMIRALGEMIV